MKQSFQSENNILVIMGRGKNFFLIAILAIIVALLSLWIGKTLVSDLSWQPNELWRNIGNTLYSISASFAAGAFFAIVTTAIGVGVVQGKEARMKLPQADRLHFTRLYKTPLFLICGSVAALVVLILFFAK